MSRLTPMMKQYQRIKRDHQDAILLFHMGDFYEMFYEDAEVASRILSIALTTRDRHKAGGVPLCGIPCHAADSYISKLLAQGRKVAVCDQVEDPGASRGLVKREVTKVITPGTILDDRLLESKSNNFLAALFPGKSLIGLSTADLSTGEFYLLEIPSMSHQELEDRLAFFAPSEVLVPENLSEDLRTLLSRTAPQAAASISRDPERFDPHRARENLLSHFGTATLDVFGCEGMTSAVTAAGALLSYIQEAQRRPLSNIVKLTPFFQDRALLLDASSQKNLEIVSNLETGRKEGSLLGTLDRTATSMGGRKLRSWLLSPLLDSGAIIERLDAVEELAGDFSVRENLRRVLKEIYDLERISGRISLNSCSPRDLASLRNSLRALPRLPETLSSSTSPLLRSLRSLDLLEDIRARLEERLVEDPPIKIKEGGVIKSGFNQALDELLLVSRDAKSWLGDFEDRERQRTAIPSLKVGYNRVFGYYIEITKANIGRVPVEYTRTQTLVNAERFHTPELKEFQSRILGAEEKIAALEQSLFEELRQELAAEAGRLQKTSSDIAVLDVLQSLAETAEEKNYCRPEIDEGYTLDITEGRHPVVEHTGEERFVPNDCRLDSGECQIMIITGPNMAGKSTYLRQVALTVLMAQVGSFVPARKARIGVIDRIFTRIGASDRLMRGQSTFMVEMIETSSILHNATPRSLVILDEVGRGTSTFDGLSIAWAVVEALHGPGTRGPRTLFATHYHHLTELPATLQRARNFNIAVREWDGKILFLRKIVEGGTDKSYGIHVAQLAGLPAATVSRAREILHNLERSEFNFDGLPQLARKDTEDPLPLPQQMDIFPSPGEVILQRLRDLNLESTTPLEAFRFLSSLKEDIEKDRDSG